MGQVTAPLSFDRIRSRLLSFDFFPQLEHFLVHTAERCGWRLAV
jgi:hypothetical protein